MKRILPGTRTASRHAPAPLVRKTLRVVFLLAMASFFPVRPAAQTSTSAPGEGVPKELEAYVGARTVVDKTTDELRADHPATRGIRPAETQDPLPAFLDKIGQTIETLRRTISNTSAEESISQNCNYTRSRYRNESRLKCLYLVYPHQEDPAVGWEEFRSNSKGESMENSRLNSSCVVTSGFVSQILLFQAQSRPFTRFRLLGQSGKNPDQWIIAFAQKPEASSSTGAFYIGNREVVLLLQGLAWFDTRTQQMERLQTNLLAPRPDANLTRHSTEISYAEVRFPPDGDPALWLPKEVQVNIEWNGWQFSNRHRYSDYRLFSVDARDGQKQILK